MCIRRIILLFIGFLLPFISFSQKKMDPRPVDSPKFNVKCGDSFVILLPSNPTTGYSWQIYEFKDSSLVAKVENTYVSEAHQTEGAPVIVGAAGHEKWIFKASKKGKAVIKFKYCRPWETDDKNAITKKYTVKVK